MLTASKLADVEANPGLAKRWGVNAGSEDVMGEGSVGRDVTKMARTRRVATMDSIMLMSRIIVKIWRVYAGYG